MQERRRRLPSTAVLWCALAGLPLGLLGVLLAGEQRDAAASRDGAERAKVMVTWMRDGFAESVAERDAWRPEDGIPFASSWGAWLVAVLPADVASVEALADGVLSWMVDAERASSFAYGDAAAVDALVTGPRMAELAALAEAARVDLAAAEASAANRERWMSWSWKLCFVGLAAFMIAPLALSRRQAH